MDAGALLHTRACYINGFNIEQLDVTNVDIEKVVDDDKFEETCFIGKQED